MEVVKTQTSGTENGGGKEVSFGKFLQNHPKIPEFPGGNLNATEIPSRHKSPGGVLPIMAYTGRLRPKGVPFLGIRYLKG